MTYLLFVRVCSEIANWREDTLTEFSISMGPRDSFAQQFPALTTWFNWPGRGTRCDRARLDAVASARRKFSYCTARSEDRFTGLRGRSLRLVAVAVLFRNTDTHASATPSTGSRVEQTHRTRTQCQACFEQPRCTRVRMPHAAESPAQFQSRAFFQ